MANAVNVSRLVDDGPLRPVQMLWIGICGLLAILDGFDTQAIAFVAPAIAKEWSLPASAFGPIFAAGLVGLCIGAIGVGPLSDRFGRKPLLLASTAIVAIFALASAFATSFWMLAALRFLTGIGLGSAMPNILTLASEYSPKRHRAITVTLISCGFPLGAVLGGALSFKLISEFGWPSVFVLGGALPLLVLPLVAIALPESLIFLAIRHGLNEQARKALKKLAPAEQPDSLTVDVQETKKVRVIEVLKGAMAVTTTLLWFVFFLNVLIMYLLINWLPLMVQQAQLPAQTGLFAAVLLNLGGITGGLALGWALDRLQSRGTIAIVYALAAAAVAGIGVALQFSSERLLIMVFITGFFVIGAMFCMHSVAAAAYPTVMRSTGLGSALGIGRLGSIVGPLIGGFLLSGALTLPQAFYSLAVPLMACAAAVLFLRVARPASNAPAAASAHSKTVSSISPTLEQHTCPADQRPLSNSRPLAGRR